MMLAEGTEVEPKCVTFGTLHSTFPPEVLTLQDAATKTKRWPARSHVSAKATSDGDVQWQEQPSLLYTVHHRISTYWETFWRVLVSSMISTKDHESLNGVSIAGLWLLNLGDQSPLILAVGGSGCYILWYVVITIGHSVSFQCIWLHLVLFHLLSRMIRNVYYNYSGCIIFMYPFRHHIEKKWRGSHAHICATLAGEAFSHRQTGELLELFLHFVSPVQSDPIGKFTFPLSFFSTRGTFRCEFRRLDFRWFYWGAVWDINSSGCEWCEEISKWTMIHGVIMYVAINRSQDDGTVHWTLRF